MLRTNISSAFYVGQAVARHMIPRDNGKIINIASEIGKDKSLPADIPKDEAAASPTIDLAQR